MKKNKIILDKILLISGHTVTTLSEILDVNPEELLQQETEDSQNKLSELLDFLKEYPLKEYLFE